MNTITAPVIPADDLRAFQLLRVIEHASDDVVYEARRPGAGRVALKVISATPVVRERWLARQELEWERLARQPAPYLPAVFDAGPCEGGLYCATELLNPQPLAEVLARDPLGAREALAVMSDLSLSLQAAHDVGILHLDLRPERLLLARVGVPMPRRRHNVRLTGFVGSARRFRRLTGPLEDDVAHGGFLAPEQRVGAAVSERTDVFGLAAVTLALLTGQAPGHEATRGPLRRSVILSGLDDLAPAGWQALQATLDRALSSEPAARFSCASMFAESLRMAWTAHLRTGGDELCAACGRWTAARGRFCGRCGAPARAVPAVAVPPAAAPAAATPRATRVGFSPGELPVARPAPARPPARRTAARPYGRWLAVALGAVGSTAVLIGLPTGRVGRWFQQQLPAASAPPAARAQTGVPAVPSPGPPVPAPPAMAGLKLEQTEGERSPAPTSSVSYEDAVALLSLGKEAEAVQALSDFLAQPRGEHRLRDRAEYLLGMLRPGLGQLDLNVEMPGVRLYIDGRPLGQTPIDRKLFLPPGSHRLTLVRGDEPPLHRSFDLTAGGRLALRLAP